MKKVRSYFAEFLGTLVIILIGGGVASQNANELSIAFAFGFAFMVAYYAFGHVSKVLFNPAYTIAKVFNREITFKDGLIFCLFQVLGAFAGVFLIYAILGENIEVLYTNYTKHPYNTLNAIVFELLISFLFYVVISGLDSKKSYTSIKGIIIGMMCTTVFLLGYNITGVGINSAISIATSVSSMNLVALYDLWIFIIFPIIGTSLGVLFCETFMEKKN